MVTTVNDHQHKKVDYADPESATLAVRQSTSTTTGADERPTYVVLIDDYTDTADMLLPGGVPTGHIQLRGGNNFPTVRNHETRSPDFHRH